MKLVSLGVLSNEFDTIADHIMNSWKDACIVEIQRVEDHCMTSRYMELKESLGECAGERTLFHGTNKAAVSNILETGYDPNYAKTCAYGKGIYFAKNASLSYQYMPVTRFSNKDDTFQLSYMFVNSVLMGRACIGSFNRACPEGFDTQVDNLESPKIVSVPRSHQALPTHVIIFHKNAN